MASPEQVAARVRAWESDGPQGPMTLELYPTLTCNLNCSFCDTTDRHRPPVNELSTERLLKLIDEAADMGVQRLFLLGGGEPLVRKDTPLLMERAKAHGMEGILTTNGTLFDADLIDRFIEMGWDEIHFSIDGPNPEIHDDLRGQEGAFKRTTEAARMLVERRRHRGLQTPRIALHFVLTNKNLHTLSQMVYLGHSLGAFRIDFDALIAYTEEQLVLQLSDAQRAQVPAMAKQALAVAKSLGIATTLENFLDVENLARGETRVKAPDAPGFKGAPCLKAWHYLVVAADGNTSPCCVLAGEGGSVVDTSLSEVWHTDPFMNRVRTGMLDKKPLPRCAECSWNILRHEAEIRRHI